VRRRHRRPDDVLGLCEPRGLQPGSIAAVVSLAGAASPNSAATSRYFTGAVRQVTGSVITFAPSEYARVRVPADGTLQSQILERVAPDRTLHFAGTLTLYLSTGTVQVRSAEGLPVLLRY
jgi:hypothetical protein